jgi:hypothetical protein
LLLEARVGEYPVQIGDSIFNSREDVEVWVEENASCLSFSLFHNPVENLTNENIEKKRCYYWHVSSYEVWIYLTRRPSIFLFWVAPKRVIKFQLTTHWAPFWIMPIGVAVIIDVKSRITQELHDLKLQIGEAIMAGCISHPKAEQLAQKRHERSQTFLS